MIFQLIICNVPGSIPRHIVSQGCLAATDLELGLLLFVYLRQTDHEDTVPLGCFRKIDVDFFGEQYGARERTPVELALVVVFFVDLLLVLPCAGYGEHLACEGYVDSTGVYSCDERLYDDGVRCLVYVYRELTGGFFAAAAGSAGLVSGRKGRVALRTFAMEDRPRCLRVVKIIVVVVGGTGEFGKKAFYHSHFENFALSIGWMRLTYSSTARRAMSPSHTAPNVRNRCSSAVFSIRKLKALCKAMARITPKAAYRRLAARGL